MNMYKPIVFSWLPQTQNAYRSKLDIMYTFSILTNLTLSLIIV